MARPAARVAFHLQIRTGHWPILRVSNMPPNPYESPTHSGDSPTQTSAEPTPPMPWRPTVIDVFIVVAITGVGLSFAPPFLPPVPQPPLWIAFLFGAGAVGAIFFVSVVIVCVAAQIVAACARIVARLKSELNSRR